MTLRSLKLFVRHMDTRSVFPEITMNYQISQDFSPKIDPTSRVSGSQVYPAQIEDLLHGSV